MNKTYRNIWNAATGTWTAVAETAKSQSKGSARAALSAVAAVAALGAPFSTATAAETCTTADEQTSTADAGNTCTMPSPVGAQSRAITPTATLDDTYIKVLPATTGGVAASATGTAAVAIGNAALANGTSVLAFGSAATATGAGSIAFGRLAVATGTTGAIAIGNDSTATGGVGATAIGNNSVANGTSVLAVGSSATATGTGSVALGRLASATANSSTALGSQASVQSVGAIALGNTASVSTGATNSIAIGSNASVAANITNAVALGANSDVTRSNTVSVGSSAQRRQIINVDAGSQVTDAVNVSQIVPLVTSLGGGAKFDGISGAVTGPLYELVNGGDQTTVGGALGALDGALTTANGDIAQNKADISSVGSQVTSVAGRTTVNETNIAKNATDITTINSQLGDLASGTIGLVQQTGAGVDLTVGATTDGAAVNFAGTAGVRKLTGIANGEIKAGSKDAITGDQLYTTNQDVAQNATNITNLGTQVTNLDGRVTTNETSIAKNTTDITTLGGDVTRIDSRVTNNESAITQINNDLNSGAIGLVQQTGAGADLTVGANTDGAAMNFAGTAGNRKLTGVANGEIKAGSNDAVTGDQLYTTNQGVAQNATNITNLGSQVTNLDGRVTTNETSIAKNTTDITKNATDITTINNQLGDLSSGTIGLVQQTGAGADLTVGANTDGVAVNFAGTVGVRKLTGIANGDIKAGSQDAVTGDQLYTTNQGVAQNASDITNLDGRVTTNETSITQNSADITTLGGDVTRLDSRVTTNESAITQINNQLGDLSSGTIGLVQQTAAGADLTVGANTDGVAVNFAGTVGVRKLTGIANGDIKAGSQDAVTGDQLYTTNQSVTQNATNITNLGTQVTSIDGRVTTNETNIAKNATDITTINNQLGDLSGGTIGLVQQTSAGADLTVGANTDGAAVNFAGTAGARKLTGIANGDIKAGSQDAVTGDQLYTTNQDVTQNATNITNLGTQVTSIDGRVTTNETNIAKNTTDITKNATDITTINTQLGDLSSGTIGLVQQTGAGADLTVGANTDGAAVNFAGTAGERKLTGISNGEIKAGSHDAVTGDQLYSTNQGVAQNASVISNLGTQVTNLDGRVTTNETNIAKNATDITTINNQLGDLSGGTIGLVQQAGAGADLMVGANTDGAAVNFAGTAGERKLTGLANGDVAAGSHDAVTGDQLHATNQAVAQNASDIADNRTDITTINTRLESGQIGLAQQDPSTGAITVGAATGGSMVDFAGTGGARTLTGVANGVNDDDAVTIAQLKATGLIDYTGKEIAALTYDDISLGSATLGGVGGTVLHNLAPGLIAAGSMDAVNGGQLHAMQQDFESRFSGLDDRVAGLESGGNPGNPGDPGNGSGGFDPVGSGAGSVQLGAGADASGGNSTAIGSEASASASNGTAIGQGSNVSGNNGTALGQGSNASGSNGTAIGQGSIASGDNGTAIGQGSNASGSNAVALGAGSVADRDNAVSVGSAGAERQITNVAAGTAPTDAVNVQQMQNSVRSVRQDAMGGVAAAMAVAGLPQSTQPGRTFVAMAGSTYGGEYGSALGVSYMTRDGKWTIKASANTSSRGTVGAVVGGGFYW
ncbi:ESPR-type extended signal peptide-containing protein [Burkholderia cenocepacia]|uniref:ESPR-type extended signal peptide-containing protein n=2 Tax=Burkholderia cepacia complex TaxID=87882 RepID=UPI00098F11BF|nr:ESPR-type extended signal peptide-containing protein [Burkholderia cenocepacia]AQT51965.1 hypothetical protein BHQ31_17800 [Burkholderia cenocepacia]